MVWSLAQKEVVVAYLNILSWNLVGKKNREKLQS